MNRINEISFNSSLMREMRAIAFVTKMIEDGTIDEGKMKQMLIHAIEGQDFMRDLGVSSKMNADWEFLTHLRDVGRERAERWLDENFSAINKKHQRRSRRDVPVMTDRSCGGEGLSARPFAAAAASGCGRS